MCGKNIKEETLPIPLGSQIATYIISFLFPPIGLWPGVKYLTGKKPNGKKVGIIALIITIIATIFLVIATIQISNKISSEVDSAFKKYQNIGP